MRRLFLAVAAQFVIGLAVVLGFVVVVALLTPSDEPGPIPFDPDGWNEAPPETDTRFRMARDLVETKRLLGLTREEVEELLGAPRSTTGKQLRYTIGGPPYNRTNLLLVDLDASGVVRRVSRD